MNQIINIIGPSAVGKTKLAIEIVKRFQCEIISVDSCAVYRGLDIGSAKPTAEELAITPHRLIDIVDPTETYSAARFCIDANREINDIFLNKNVPLLVGGTMLYFRALHFGISELPTSNSEIREYLKKEVENIGLPALYEQLKKIDIETANRLKPNDVQRILRALEIYEISGHTMTELIKNNKPKPLPYKTITIGLMPNDRAALHKRIQERFDLMIKNGIIDEVKRLRERIDLHGDLPPMRSVGYRQVWSYLDGKISYDEMYEKSIAATRQLAKRQMTWMRSWPDIILFDSDSKTVFDDVVGIASLCLQ